VLDSVAVRFSLVEDVKGEGEGEADHTRQEDDDKDADPSDDAEDRPIQLSALLEPLHEVEGVEVGQAESQGHHQGAPAGVGGDQIRNFGGSQEVRGEDRSEGGQVQEVPEVAKVRGRRIFRRSST